MIEAQGLTKQYAGRTVVDDLTFTAPDGVVTGFLGPNGAGKTTTFRMLLGLSRPDGGVGLIDRKRYADLPHPRTVVGAVLESGGFHAGRSGRDHLRVIQTAAGLPPPRVDEALELVGLQRAAARKVGGYSLGMRQRLGLASALLGHPSTLLLDEPTNGLDPQGVAWVRRLVRDQADQGHCVLVSSHQIAELAQVVDRIVIMADGQGRLEIDVASLVPDLELVVKSSQADLLGRALAREGVMVNALAASEIYVTGLTRDELLERARLAGIDIEQVTAPTQAQLIESCFLRVTATGGVESLR